LIRKRLIWMPSIGRWEESNDETYRSQYDLFALEMCNALPNVTFIGFTGTLLSCH